LRPRRLRGNAGRRAARRRSLRRRQLERRTRIAAERTGAAITGVAASDRFTRRPGAVRLSVSPPRLDLGCFLAGAARPILAGWFMVAAGNGRRARTAMIAAGSRWPIAVVTRQRSPIARTLRFHAGGAQIGGRC
jgi:hypothetical protein